MDIRDIVNKGIVDLENCEQEPIHIPGSIQPNGFLLGINKESWQVEYCSANTNDHTSTEYTDILSKTFSAFAGDDNQEALRKYIEDKVKETTPLRINIKGEIFDCLVHSNSNVYIFEAEPVMDSALPMPDIYEENRQFLEIVEHTKSFYELCDNVARRTRELTGYDRVMIYKFDEFYNGEVYAESKREDLESFLGLHYPHTDIPMQARELYLSNLLRIITDVDYTPVPIYTFTGRDNKDLDLSHAVLRSTSPIHVQYLHNMGVGATLTISLIHKGKLWGLIACHHYSAKNIPHHARIAAKIQGHFITSQIDVRQSNEEYDIAKRSNEALEKLLHAIRSHNYESFNELVNNKALLEVCNASGVSIVVNGVTYSSGSVPSVGMIEEMASSFAEKTNRTSYYTSELKNTIEQMENVCETVSGLLYHSLGINNNDCIMWFRPETIDEVHWAGDPKKAIVKDEKGLHPRKSFEKWKEIVECRSKPWLEPELNAAANFSYALQRQVALLAVTKEEQKYRELAEILKESNKELENINWISTHDLQEPLRKIRIMSSRIISSKDEFSISDKLDDMLSKIDSSAGRMQQLLKDMLDYTKVINDEGSITSVNLNDLIQVVVDDYSEVINEKGVEVVVKELPEINGIPFLLKQLFTNLIGNAIKFSGNNKQVITIEALPSLQRITLPSGMDELYQQVKVSDTGIGFDQQYVESIFKIFTRLNPQHEYKGSGMGLALCKKIMQSHNGFIRAEGSLGEGATFKLYFPQQD